MEKKTSIKCVCLNNTPVKLESDTKGGERFECFYCKFKWRYINIYNTLCDKCNDPHSLAHGLNQINYATNHNNKCIWCRDTIIYATRKMLVFW